MLDTKLRLRCSRSRGVTSSVGRTLNVIGGASVASGVTTLLTGWVLGLEGLNGLGDLTSVLQVFPEGNL